MSVFPLGVIARFCVVDTPVPLALRWKHTAAITPSLCIVPIPVCACLNSDVSEILAAVQLSESVQRACFLPYLQY